MYEILSFYLSNGLKVIMHKMPNTRTMSCGIWVKQGSKYEDDDTNGFSHLIEHLLVSAVNTDNQIYKDVINDITLNGVEYNATTTKEHTCYYFTGLNNMIGASLDALANIVISNKKITKEKFEIEKEVVCQEIISFYSSFNQITERTSQALWGNLDIGKTIVGNIKNVKSAEVDKIVNMIDNSYTPENSMLVIVGDIEYQEVLSIVEEKFSRWMDVETRDYVEVVNSVPGIYINNENKGKTSALSVGFRLNSQYHDKDVAIDIISTILGHASLESRIAKRIRVDNGLAYSLNSFKAKYSNRGTLAFAAITANENVEMVIDLLIDEIKKAKRDFFTEDEIRKAKNILTTQAILNTNDLTKHLRFLGNSAINDKIFSLENEVRKIKKCSNDLIQGAMDEIFINDNIGLAAIGSFNSNKVIEMINI